MCKHTALGHLNTEISTSPQVQACLHNGKIRVKRRNEEVLSHFLADFVFLHVTAFWKESHCHDWWVSRARDLCRREVGMAMVQAEACSWPHPSRDHSILVLIFHFWEIPFNFISLPCLLHGKWWVSHVPAQNLCFCPPLSCVCVHMCKCTHLLTHTFDLLSQVTLELVFGSSPPPGEAALLCFLAPSSLADLSWNFGLKLRFH